MNKENYLVFKRLSNFEARQFFILYIGLDSFLKGDKIYPLTKKQFQKETSNIVLVKEYHAQAFSFRLRIEKESGTEYLLYRNKDRKILLFRLNFKELTQFRDVDSYNDDLPSEIIDLLLDVSHNNITGDLDYKKRIDKLLLLRKPSEFSYRFVVGAGVNHDYGMPSWKQFEAVFINEVDSLLRKKSCKDINEAVFNTNYGTFQIVKDIIYPQYAKLLGNMVNQASIPQKGKNTILEAISGVLDTQRKLLGNQSVLTFNYDDLLEQSLLNCFHLKSKSVFKYDSLLNPAFPISVIHSHGFLPRVAPIPKKFYNSIVLTTNEYINNYKYSSSFGYSTLYNHLDKTCCFVGNSLTDYEEQKVISAHFAKNPSSFHYWYGSIGNMPKEAVMYKTIFLLKIGVIPLWFSSHDDYKKEFFDYANGLGR